MLDVCMCFLWEDIFMVNGMDTWWCGFKNFVINVGCQVSVDEDLYPLFPADYVLNTKTVRSQRGTNPNSISPHPFYNFFFSKSPSQKFLATSLIQSQSSSNMGGKFSKNHHLFSKCPSLDLKIRILFLVNWRSPIGLFIVYVCKEAVYSNFFFCILGRYVMLLIGRL